MTRNLFDNWFYSFGYGVLSRFRGKGEYRAVFNSVALPDHPKVLDVGTGYGAVFQADFPSGSEVVGIDSSSRMIEQASKAACTLEKRCSGVRAQVVKATATDIPFDNNYFDVLIDSWCLPHLARKGTHKKALEEYRRVTSKTGLVIISPSRPWTDWPIRLPGLSEEIERTIVKVFPAYEEKTLINNRWPIIKLDYNVWSCQS